MIPILYEGGVLDAIDGDLRTWRHMLAPYVVIIGRYCLEIGHLLQQWQLDGRQRMRQFDDSPGATSSEINRNSDMDAELRQVDHVIRVLKKAEWLADVTKGACLDKVLGLWDVCSTNSSSSGNGTADNSAGSSNSSSNGLGIGPLTVTDQEILQSAASRWQQQHSAAGQQQMPAYGNLASECGALLHVTTPALIQQCLSLALLTEQRLDAIERGELRLPSRRSSSDSSSGGGNRSSGGGNRSSGGSSSDSSSGGGNRSSGGGNRSSSSGGGGGSNSGGSSSGGGSSGSSSGDDGGRCSSSSSSGSSDGGNTGDHGQDTDAAGCKVEDWVAASQQSTQRTFHHAGLSHAV
jgi:hypothetical protein